MPGQAAANLSTAARRAYPMTQQAFDALVREIDELDATVRDELSRGFSLEDREIPSPLLFPGQTTAAKAKRLTALRAVASEAEIVRARSVAAIGRRVIVSEPDGTRERYSIVLPGDGDPFNGWVSADSPIGSALLWATAGQHVLVHAPAGQRSIQVLGVENQTVELVDKGRLEVTIAPGA